MTSRVWPVIVSAALGIVVLMVLGTWQLQRRAWKETLLAAVDTRLEALPVDLVAALAAEEAGDDVEFLKVTVRGSFLHGDTKLMLSTFEGRAGWEVITPLVSDSRIAVLVNRGIVPPELRDSTRRIVSNPGEVTGIVRRHSTARNIFSPDNDVTGNMWYWWDVPAMLAASRIPPDAKVAPFVVQALPAANDRSFPRPQEARAAFRNNHLQYALTWFGLAAVLAVMGLVYVREQMKKPALDSGLGRG